MIFTFSDKIIHPYPKLRLFLFWSWIVAQKHLIIITSKIFQIIHCALAIINKEENSPTSEMKVNIALPQVQDIKSQPKEDDVLEQLCLYECDICEKILSNAKTLEAHFKQIHKSNLAFACNTCTERYPKLDLLNQHMLCCNW